MIQNKFLRTLVYLLGWSSLVLGFIGAFLPLLPTTPFVLLAAWCFVKSSPTAYNWLKNHKIFGPPLINWQKRGAISPRAKGMAVLAILVSLVMMWIRVDMMWVKILVSCVLMCSTTFILTRPN